VGRIVTQPADWAVRLMWVKRGAIGAVDADEVAQTDLTPTPAPERAEPDAMSPMT